MGVCLPATAKVKLPPGSSSTFRSGPQVLGVDISSFQGCPTLAGARFVIAKAGEGAGWTDPTFGCHVAAARARGIPWGAYYFQRPGDQVAQARRFVSLVSPRGPPPLGYTIDSEVGVSASATCVFAHELWVLTHRIPLIYTSPGLWPGGGSCGAYLWVADYASHFVLPRGFSRALAWQFTDGQFGPFPHSIGGLTGDIDQDLGLLAAEHPAAPHLYCFGRHAHVRNTTCVKVRRQVAGWTAARDASQRAYERRGCVVLAQRDQWFSNALRVRPHQRASHRRAALAATRHAESQRACAVFASRARYFDQLVRQAHHTY